jgi:Ca2+-binding RTX toxin-like protein
MATINTFFTDGDDTFNAVNPANNYFLAFLDGDDHLIVNGAAFVTAAMGEGSDHVELRSGDALIYGDGGTDTFDIYGNGFEARGGDSGDLFNLRGGNNLTLLGDGGNDSFDFLAGSLNISVKAGDGDDYLNGNGMVISGLLNGGAGNDRFEGFRNAGGTVPTLAGGAGNDVYRADPTAPATFLENLSNGIDTLELARGRSYTLGANIENITVLSIAGSLSAKATLTGNGIANVIQGSANAETINGADGNDSLFGNGGVDLINGGGDNDLLYGGGSNDTLNGNLGNDLLDGGTGNDLMTGGSGNDTYYIDTMSSDLVTEASGGGIDLVRVNLAFGSVYTLTAYVENGEILNGGFGTLHGNDLNNILTGGEGSQYLYGEAGNDKLYGEAGNDGLTGAAGNDTLDGGLGADNMTGGTGDDRYFLSESNDGIYENVGEGTDTIYLSPPGVGTVLSYTMADNVENLLCGTTTPSLIYGNDLSNSITGSSGGEDLWGKVGNDTIYGLGGDDTIFGNDGSDTIVGGNGDDFISGDGGGTTSFAGDILTGGGGADRFHYYFVDDSAPFIGRSDRIMDFETGSDTIGLDCDANVNVADKQNWTLVSGFSNTAGELFIDSSDAANGNYIIYGDDDGDGLADLKIEVHALGGFVATDILL